MNAPRPIADQLRALIKAEMDRGVSLREIARRADVAPSVISTFMQGKSIILETAEAIAKAIGKPLHTK